VVEEIGLQRPELDGAVPPGLLQRYFEKPEAGGGGREPIGQKCEHVGSGQLAPGAGTSNGVVDAHGNSTTYFYDVEKNKYARNGESGKSTEYIRGGHVRDIVYSRRSGDEGTTAPALHHGTPGCIDAADGSGTCPAFEKDHASSYPDIPMDQVCTGSCTGDEQKSARVSFSARP